ncbi:hypothetical protein IWQ62_005839 [Dispira parvispora]|uniref:GRAM domain-containing protein n=1 Tax=Dispira parvispora TaxID=1520584 RepID=A0A9W8E4V6_9FUNG|nr:hypothetical protein IWQ62_005839 [Dispira parvispora]
MSHSRHAEHLYRTLHAQVSEIRTIPARESAPTFSEFRTPDGRTDYYGYASAWFTFFIHRYAADKVDPEAPPSEFHLTEFLGSLDQLGELSDPYQRLAAWLMGIALWSSFYQSAFYCGLYWLFLYWDLLVPVLLTFPLVVLAWHAMDPHLDWGFNSPVYDPWYNDGGSSQRVSLASGTPEPHRSGGIPQRRSRSRLSKRGRAKLLTELWDLWYTRMGPIVHRELEDRMELLEKVRNAVKWRYPPASWYVVGVVCMYIVATLVFSCRFLTKYIGCGVGIEIFFLFRLRVRYPRYRRIFSILHLHLWPVPNDAAYAMQLLHQATLPGVSETDLDPKGTLSVDTDVAKHTHTSPGLAMGTASASNNPAYGTPDTLGQPWSTHEPNANGEFSPSTGRPVRNTILDRQGFRRLRRRWRTRRARTRSQPTIESTWSSQADSLNYKSLLSTLHISGRQSWHWTRSTENANAVCSTSEHPHQQSPQPHASLGSALGSMFTRHSSVQVASTNSGKNDKGDNIPAVRITRGRPPSSSVGQLNWDSADSGHDHAPGPSVVSDGVLPGATHGVQSSSPSSATSSCDSLLDQAMDPTASLTSFDHTPLAATNVSLRFRCVYHSFPGILYIESQHFYFRKSRLLGAYAFDPIPLDWITGVRKCQSLNLMVYKSPGLEIQLSNNQTVVFHGVAQRDAAFHALLVRSSKKWHHV